MEGLTFEENPSAPMTPSPNKRGINKRFLFLVAGIIIFILLIFVGFKFLGSSGSGSQLNAIPTSTQEFITGTPTTAPTETPAATAAPSPTSTNTLDRSNLSVSVENGSGVTGVAGKAATYLTNLGYNVASTGNADNYNFVGVTIQVKNSSKDYLNLLKNDLSKNYTISAATSDLPASSSADALVIIGQ